jgi:hypothetical protein
LFHSCFTLNKGVADDTKKSLTSMDLFPSCVGSMPEPPIHAEQTNEIVQINADWCSGVEKVFDFFERRTPGSYTERTTGTVTWYWDDTLPDFGKQQVHTLLLLTWLKRVYYLINKTSLENS